MLRLSGLLSQRPPAGSAKNARYYATDNETIYFSGGDSWLADWPLDQTDISTTISAALSNRPTAASCVGSLFVDSGTGDQYEAFPTAWAAVSLAGGGGGSGVVDGQQLFDADHVLSLDAGARRLFAGDGVTPVADWTDLTAIRWGLADDASLLAYFDGATYHELYLQSFGGGSNIDLATDTAPGGHSSVQITADNIQFIGNLLGDATGLTNISIINNEAAIDETFALPAIVRSNGQMCLVGSVYTGPSTITTNDGLEDVDVLPPGAYALYITIFGAWLRIADTSNAGLLQGPINARFAGFNNGDGLANIDLLNRNLYANDGTTVGLGWTAAGVLGIIPEFDWGASFQADNPADTTSDIRLYIASISSTHQPTLTQNIDVRNRKLYNPNGTTVAVDYGTNDSVFIFGSNIEFDSDGGFFLPNFSVTPSGTVAATEFSTLNNMIRFEESGTVILGNLPSSDPHITGQLWNSSGNMKISAG